MEYGLLVLRLVIGLVVAAHGARMLAERARETRRVSEIGYRAPRVVTALSALAELAGGLLLAIGLLTPLAALGIVAVRLSVVAAWRWRRGFWSRNGGIEYDLVLVGAAVAVAVAGPGRLSLDAALGWAEDVSGVAWGAGVLAVGIVVAFFATTLGRGRAESTEVPA